MSSIKESRRLTFSEALEKLGPKRLFGDMRTLEQRRALRYFCTEGGQQTPEGVVGIEFVLEIDGEQRHFVATGRGDGKGKIRLKDTMIFHRLPTEDE